MHYGLSAGLASNETNTVAQDEAGYIWIGTANGLQRFDGLRYKSFRANKKDPSAIPNNFVYQILFDKEQNLWLSTGDGKLGIFDTHNFTYRQVKVKVKDESYLLLERELIMNCNLNG